MTPKRSGRPSLDREPAAASAATVGRPRLCHGRMLARLACMLLGCLLLSGCTLFGKTDKSSQRTLAPSFKPGVTQTTTPKKSNKDSGGSWLTSWMRPKEPPPPRSIGEWMELKQSKLPPSI